MSHLIQFFKHPIRIASILPSSKSVAKTIAESIDFTIAEHIVELGAGDGPITKILLPYLKPDSKITVIEIDKKLCNDLNKKFQNEIKIGKLEIITGNALELRKYITTADYVINELPTTLLTKQKREQFFTDIKAVTKYACIQLNHSPNAGKQLREHFSDVKAKLVILNFPPAYVYIVRSNATYNSGART